MKKIKLLIGIFISIMTCAVHGAEYICESTELTHPNHKSASLEFNDQSDISLANPIIFTYAGKSYPLNFALKAHSFCKNKTDGEWQCGGSNQAPVTNISYSAGDRDNFFFELYWAVKPNFATANYAAVYPFFLGIVHESIVLKCKEKTP